MTLNATGQISLGGATLGQSIALEINQTSNSTISLNDYNIRTLFGDASGAISLGNGYSKNAGPGYSLWGCGLNNASEFGNGLATNASSPVQIATGLSWSWSHISIGSYHSMLLKGDGTLWATSTGAVNGQLGVGNTLLYSSFVQVGAMTNWANVACGYLSTFATKTDGTLWAWGYNAQGELGTGNIINYSSPVQVGALTNWASVACGYQFTAATKTDGTLWAWGINTYGQLGQTNIVSYSSPVQVGALTNWSKIVAGKQHLMAIKTDGTLWGCGYNGNGALGYSTNLIAYSSPVQIGALTNWLSVGATTASTFATKTDGTLWAWGINNNSNLPTSNGVFYSSPVQVGSLTNWASIYSFCTSYGALASKTDGTLWGWGRSLYGQLAQPVANYSSPVQVGTSASWVIVAVGPYNVIGVQS